MRTPSRRSRWGLDATNFFLAEVVGVVLPFLSDYLQSLRWSYEAIGVASATLGLGTFLMQTPAGMLVDRTRSRRGLLAATSLLLGAALGLLPVVPGAPGIIDPLLLVGGAAQAFFAPLLGALALGLVGYEALDRTFGSNQSWSHAGNIAAALVAMALVRYVSLVSVFYAVTAVSVIAALCVALIRPGEIDARLAAGLADGEGAANVSFRRLLRQRNVLIFVAAVACFHLANAPVMPLVALYVKHLKGTNTEVAGVVLTAQTVMIPVAAASAWSVRRFGRKATLAVGFVALPLRILLYTLTHDPRLLVALQALDGIGAGIYGVVSVVICSDLTRGKGGFNSLQGLIATAQGLGAVVGPLASGVLVQRLGFAVAFWIFAGVAGVGAALFLAMMPETGRSGASETECNLV